MLTVRKTQKNILSNWPQAAQTHFCTLPYIIHDVAKVAGIGGLTETLKWGEPAWLPKKSGIGSTLRASWPPKRPKTLGLFLNCNSTLPETMRTLYPTTFEFGGIRAISLPLDCPLPTDALHHCAHLTLTYHRTKT